MRKLILIVHTSLDGFVAYRDGSFSGFETGEGNLQFVCDLTKTADTALFGRISYQLLDSYWPAAKDAPNASSAEITYSEWYNNAQKVVVSATLTDSSNPGTTVISTDIVSEISMLKQLPGKDILLFGSPSLFQFLMPLNLVDSYWIFLNPVVFGQGIPLFTETGQQLKSKFKLTEVSKLDKDELALHYQQQIGDIENTQPANPHFNG